MNESSIHPSNFAGFWVRFAAVCIDLVLSAPLYYGVEMAFGPQMHWAAESIFIVLAIAAYAFFFSSRWQGTPGMYILQFHICDDEGNRISFGRGIYWIITSFVGWAVCFAGIIYLQAHFDMRAVQDLQASCLDQNVAVDDCRREIESLIHIPYANFMELVYASMALFAFLALIWALSIALPKDKTGFHNVLCRTRFLKGRPPQSGHEPVPQS